MRLQLLTVDLKLEIHEEAERDLEALELSLRQTSDLREACVRVRQVLEGLCSDADGGENETVDGERCARDHVLYGAQTVEVQRSCKVYGR